MVWCGAHHHCRRFDEFEFTGDPQPAPRPSPPRTVPASPDEVREREREKVSLVLRSFRRAREFKGKARISQPLSSISIST